MRGDPRGRRRPKLTRAPLKGVDPNKSPNGPVYFQRLQLAAERGLLPERASEAIVASYQSQYRSPRGWCAEPADVRPAEPLSGCACGDLERPAASTLSSPSAFPTGAGVPAAHGDEPVRQRNRLRSKGRALAILLPRLQAVAASRQCYVCNEDANATYVTLWFGCKCDLLT